ncbi:hypothetical protein C2W62_06620 [Candidatus Entotheonella serta]|nr:hypothetical protein C2W62_06620 [Candidatus Entotheonella serta]
MTGMRGGNTFILAHEDIFVGIVTFRFVSAVSGDGLLDAYLQDKSTRYPGCWGYGALGIYFA